MRHLLTLLRRRPTAADLARSRAAERGTGRLASSDWAKLRAAPMPQDLRLSAPAQVWRQSLPALLRPRELCERYPRIANRLALCWRDPALTEQLFDELLIDHRGGRRGFPPAVAAELLKLREWHARRPRRETAEDRWSPRLLALSDR